MGFKSLICLRGSYSRQILFKSVPFKSDFSPGCFQQCPIAMRLTWATILSHLKDDEFASMDMDHSFFTF